MSSPKRPASAASAASTTVSHLYPSTVEFGGYLDRVYDQNMLESAAAHAAHVKASDELHQAQVAMMRSKRAIRALNDELARATAAAAAATALVDRRREAADAASPSASCPMRTTCVPN